MANANASTAAQFSSFKEAYDTLRQTAEELRSQDEPDIDGLATKVVRSVDAYKECDKRITAVEKALESVFARDDVKSGTGVEIDSTPRQPSEPRPGNGQAATAGAKFDDFEDDIPF